MQGLDRDKRSQALSLRESELARAFQERQFKEQQRQFNEQLRASERQAAAARAAQTADLSRYLGGAGGQQAPAGPRAVQDRPGSFSFFSADNRPITAGQYARQAGMDIRDVLFEMGNGGNQRAAQLYNQLRVLKGPQLNNAISMYQKTFPYVFNGYLGGN